MTSHSHVDQKTTVQELMNRVRGFRDSRDWRKCDTPRNLASSICIEAGELLEHFQWKTDEQTAEMLRNVEKPGKTSRDFRRAGRRRHLLFGFLRNLGYRCFQRRSDKAPEKRREISGPKTSQGRGTTGERFSKTEGRPSTSSFR